MRWVDTAVMDEEQYLVERWECTEIGGYRYWRCSSEGCEEYGRLRRSRRAQRKEAWQAREQADEEWSQRVSGFVEGGEW